MPACTENDYYSYPVVVPKKNKVDMVYDWKPNTVRPFIPPQPMIV